MNAYLICAADKNGYSVELPLSMETETEIRSNVLPPVSNFYSNQKTPTKFRLLQSFHEHNGCKSQQSHASANSFCASQAIPLCSSTDLIEGLTDRKHKDMMRKRLLRQSSEYRQQETARSRNRMKLKRSDPIYRELERQRDRERRRLARMCNPEQRAAERERDRLYKRRTRTTATISQNEMPVSHEVIVLPNSPLPLPSSCSSNDLDDTSIKICDSEYPTDL